MLEFVSGFVIETTSVFWTHYSERGRALHAAAFSALQALTLVFGVGASVESWHRAVFFVAGYALGSYVAIKFKASVSSNQHGRPMARHTNIA